MKVVLGLILLLSVVGCSPITTGSITDFTTLIVNDNNGQSRIIKRHHRKWRLINFWATWCEPCRKEMPALEQLSQQLSGQLDILIVSVDEDNNLVKEFLYQYQITMPSYIATQSSLEQQLAITQYPTTLLVSPQGKVKHVYIGARDWASSMMIQRMEQYFES